MTTNRGQRDGVEWVEEYSIGQKRTWSFARWTVLPDPEAIKEIVGNFFPSTRFKDVSVRVTYLTRGALNRIYNVHIKIDELDLDSDFIMRVSLPVEPKLKTLSEVATVEWVRRNTCLPVPRLYAQDASRDNPLGFEWMLMSKVSGRPLFEVWWSIDWTAKKQIVQHLANFSASSFRKQLRGIGNIYPTSKSEVLAGVQDKGNDDIPVVGRMVSNEFLWGKNLWQSISRGPFQSSKAWIEARLSLVEQDCNLTIAKFAEMYPLDKHSRTLLQTAKETLRVIERLKRHIISEFFPSSKEDEAENTMLCHTDLTTNNILVDQAGVLTGVVDWECVAALPLWKACNYPTFLMARSLYEKPDKANRKYKDKNGNFSEEKHWNDMLRYELTLLRQHFLNEMTRLEPDWVKVHQASKQKRDFEFILHYCNHEGRHKSVNLWIDGVLGKTKLLRAREAFSLWSFVSSAKDPDARSQLMQGRFWASDFCKVPLSASTPEPSEAKTTSILNTLFSELCEAATQYTSASEFFSIIPESAPAAVSLSASTPEPSEAKTASTPEPAEAKTASTPEPSEARAASTPEPSEAKAVLKRQRHNRKKKLRKLNCRAKKATLHWRLLLTVLSLSCTRICVALVAWIYGWRLCRHAV